MKQKAKSLLALVLALSLCLSMVCVPAAASDTDNIAVADGATVTIAEEAEDGADDDESAEADTSADEAEPEADASADEPAEEEAEADEPAADEAADESEADEPADEADALVVAAEGEDEEAAEETADSATVLTSEGGTLSSGSYILEADVALSTDLTIESGSGVTIDLAGYTLTGTGTASVITVSGSLTLEDSSEAGTGTITGGSASYGGGIYLDGATLTMNGGTISGNKATIGGGGVYVKNQSVFTMNDGAISGNTSTGTSHGGGGVYIYGNATSKGSVSTFVMNGGTISNNTSAKWGGGVFVDASSASYEAIVTITGGAITGNSVTASASYGGGIATNGVTSTITITDSTISGNSGTTGGGAYVSSKGTLNITNCTLSDNTADRGGAVSVVGTLNMTDSTVSGNTATSSGGGIRSESSSGTFNLTRCTITGNSATTGSGGGLYIWGDLTLTDCDVTGNTSATTGGGLFLYPGAVATVSGGTLANNTAATAGDDVYASTSTSKQTSLTLSGTPSGTLTSCGDAIDGWYVDAEDARWSEDTASVAVDTSEALTTADAAIALKAAHVVEPVVFAIVTNPVDVTAVRNTSATFSVEATGTDLTYQWQYQTANGTKWYNCTATTSESYSTDSITLTAKIGRNGYKYRCVVTNGDGETLTSEQAVLTVTYAAQNVTTSTTYTTLQAAIDEASSGDEIELMIDLTEDVTVASDDVITLDLAGYTLTGTGTTSVVTVNGNLTLTDSSQEGTGTITGGSATSGGGFCVDGADASLTMNGGTISGNTATNGAGVYVKNQALFTMNDGEISGNTATGTSHGGGGVYVYGSSARNDTVSTFIMNGGKITNNTSGKWGGGVFADASSVSYEAVITINGGEISGNSVSASASYGGGIGTNAVTCTVTITGGTITGNSATTGGGVYGSAKTTLDISNCTITGNTASEGAGVCSVGTLTMTDCAVTDNTATSCGGGVRFYSSTGTAVLTGCTITGNSVTSTGKGGGGLYIWGTATVTDCTITGNTSADCGGGLFLYPGAVVTVSGGTLANNTSDVAGDDAFARYSSSKESTLTLGTASGTLTTCGHDIDGWYADAEDARWSDTNAVAVDTTEALTTAEADIALKAAHSEVVAQNVTTSTTYTTLQAAIDEASSGDEVALLMDVTEDVTVASDDVITLDLAGYTLTGTGTTRVIANYGNLTIQDSSEAGTGTITGGSGANGGGVYTSEGTILTLNGGTITGNSATNGGGVCVDKNATFTMNGGSITGNTASNGGGGVYGYSGSTLTITDSDISGNTAYMGAGVCNSGDLTMTNSTVTGNTATGSGGGFRSVYSSGTFTFTGCTITGNSATSGGGVYVWATATFTDCTITGNTSSKSGGGMYIYQGSTVTISGGTLANNTAGTAGDDVFAAYSSARQTSLTLDGTPSGTLTDCGHDINGWYDDSADARWSETNTVAVDTSEALSTAEAAISLKAAHAEIVYVAQNVTTSTNYETLQAAIDAASSGDEVALLMDVTEDVTVAADDVITLDLAGYTLTGTGTTSVIIDNGDLTLKDSSEAGTGTVTGGSASYGGGVYVGSSATLTMNSGTITGNYASNSGGGVYLYNDATFTMNGGTISNNTAKYNGGGVCTKSGNTVTMNGGTISGNSGNYAGGVYLYSSSTLIMNDGTISGNTATNRGGGIGASWKSTVTMNGGEISGNSAASGGGISALNEYMTLTITGGTITGNTVTTYGGGIYLYSGTDNIVNLTGGTITGNTATKGGGGIYAYSTSTAINVSGNPVVTGNTTDGSTANNIYLAANTMYITLGELTEGASIGVTTKKTPTATTAVQFTTTETETSYYATSAGYFTSDKDGYKVQVNEAGYLELSVITYVAENVTTSTKYETLQVAIDAASSGDEVALLTDVTEDVTVASDDVITLDLAGYTLTGTGTTSVVTINGDLTLKDSSEAGTGTVTGGNKSNGGGFYVNGVDASFTMNGGTITGNTATNGAGVYVQQRAVFTMNGGTITGNTATSRGGGVLIGASSSKNETVTTFTMTGGKIVNNTSAKFGGGVAIHSSTSTYTAVVTMTGGEISGNTTTGSATYGGGISSNATCTLDISGVTITGNYAVDGGGIYASTNTVMTIANSTITDNTAQRGGGIDATGTLTMTDTTVTGNSAECWGAGVYFSNTTGTAALTGCTITGNAVTGTTSSYASFDLGGAGVYANGSTVTITDCTITGNTSIDYAGGLLVYPGTTVTVSGGTLANNTATTAADDVYVEYGTTKTSTVTLSTPSGTLTACGHDIDGWYDDSADARWTETNSTTVDTSETLSTADGAITLKAAHSAEFAIVTDPEDVTADKGDSVTFTVVATGTDLTYQWQYQTANGTKWYNCTSATGEGYASDSITLTANTGREGYKYRCVVTNGDGETLTSEQAVLTVTTPAAVDAITITAQPESVTAAKGDSVTLTVEATSNLGETLTYQWQYQTATGSKWYNCTSATGEGYASESVTLTANKGRNGYKYRCKITDESGNVVYTDVITLTVTTE